LTIAIYSGTIPSTTFIENLIEGLADSGLKIILFGKKTGRVNYRGNVKVIETPENVGALVLFVLKEYLKLFFRDRKLFIKTAGLLKKKSGSLKKQFKDAGVLLPIANNQPDIFHIQWAKTIDRYPEIFKLLKCRFVLSLRGAHINYSPVHNTKLAESYKKFFPLIDSFHAVSKAIAEESTRYGADPRKIKVIYSSVRDDLLNENNLAADDSEILKIISIGRFHWKKGYHYALDAMNILKEKKIRFDYTIVAHGVIPEEILFLIDEYDLSNEVKIIPGLKHDTLVKTLQQSHLLLLPSVEEGIANVVLEAMSLGIPVITTDCGGMSEVIIEKSNGYIVPVRNPAKIASRIIEFIASGKSEKEIITAGALQTIRDNFSRARQIDEFKELYNSLVQVS